MKITIETKYDGAFVSAERFFSDATKDKLTETAQAYYGSYYDMPFARFWHCVGKNDFSFIKDGDSVFGVYWLRGFLQFAKDFVNLLSSFTIPPTAEERRAASGLLKVDFFEGTLVFLQSFFGLKSFADAEKITLGELLIARRTDYNNKKYQRALNNLYMRRLNKKR